MRRSHIAALLAAWGCALSLGVNPALAFEGFAPSPPGAGADSADGRRAAAPTVRAHRLNGGGEIRVDGKLDDNAWKTIEPGQGFRVWDPDRGALPTEETVFKVAYDDGAVYFGVACLEHDASKISANLARRDRDSKSDLVSIYIDPYFDKTTGYNFRVNPLGVQLDSYIYNDGDRDDNWDAVWEAATSRDQSGWYAEIRIPFSAIRYKTGSTMTWGLQIYRFMQGRGEDTAWAIWDRNAHGFVSHFGTLTGIEGIRPPRQIELLPYVVQRSTDPSIDGPDDQIEGFRNLGADLKYGITGDLTLNATVQPDFGQVEADPAQLNLSPFETFYDEKRPFFVEGSRFFQHPDFNLVYSRRIGTGDPNSRIRYAAKLTGKTWAGVSLAAMAASTDITAEGQAHNLFKNGSQLSRFFVARLGKEISGGRNRFNVMQTAVLNTANRDQYTDAASHEAYTSGLDFDLNSKNRQFNAQGSFVGSIIDPETSALDPTITGAPSYGTGGSLDLRRRGGSLQGGVNGRWESGHLEINDLGYLQSPDEISSSIPLLPVRPEWEEQDVQPRRAEPERVAELDQRGAGGLRRRYRSRGVELRQGSSTVRWRAIQRLVPVPELPRGVVWNLVQRDGTPSLGDPGRTPDQRAFDLWWMAGRLVRHAEESSDVARGFLLPGHRPQREHRRDADHEVEAEHGDQSQPRDGISPSNRRHAVPRDRGPGDPAWRDRNRRAELRVWGHQPEDVRRDASLEHPVHAEPIARALRAALPIRGQLQPSARAHSPGRLDLYTYLEPGYAATNFDFSFVQVNINVVYRWEYRPGSTFYFVWTQGRNTYDERDYHTNPNDFNNSVGNGELFKNEPENTLLAKITYWFAI